MGQIQINGGRRWAEDRFVPNTFLTYELPDEPTDICLQLGEEDLILPGLLDMHTHLWAPPAVSSFGIAEEKYYATGFVGALDAAPAELRERQGFHAGTLRQRTARRAEVQEPCRLRLHRRRP